MSDILEKRIDIRPRPQVGHLCGMCCLAGITNRSVDEIFQTYLPQRKDGTCYGDIWDTAMKMYGQGLVERINNDLPRNTKIVNPEYMEFGDPSWGNFNSWFENVQVKINNGYVGMCTVNKDGNAMGDRKHQWTTNHWVIINGYYNDKDKIIRKVYISCSVRGDYEVGPLEFLMNYGGYNAIWIKPKENETESLASKILSEPLW
jgi:hypothetical protein